MSWDIEFQREGRLTIGGIEMDYRNAVGSFSREDVGPTILVENPFWRGQEHEISSRMSRFHLNYDADQHRLIELMHYRGTTIQSMGLVCPKHPDDQYLPINLWDETL
jgi:hypothetical protein